MRVLAVGSVPPPRAEHRQALLEAVLDLRAAGHEVQVLSLDPVSAAHRFLVGPGLPAAVEVGLLARSADAIVLQLEPGLPVRRGAGRLERSLALLTLAAMLRRHGEVTVRLHRLDDLPGGPGGRAAAQLWKVASRLEVGDSAVAEQLAVLMPDLAGRLTVVTDTAASCTPSEPQEAALDRWGSGADATAAAVQAAVRRRAAADRRALAIRGGAARGGPARTRVPLWEWLPEHGVGVPDLGPSRATVRRHAEGEPPRQPRPRSVRQLASSALALAERRPLTRPAAQVTRLAIGELRSAVRR